MAVAAQDRQQPDGASEPFGEAAAQADLPDEGTAASGHRADPPDPATAGESADDSPSDESGTQSGANIETPAGSAAEVPESDGPAAEAGTDTAAATGGRRASGTLRGAILDILEANPGQRYKVSELCKLINKACEGTGAKKAGAGAVVNSANKLVETGRAVLAVEKPATFALADPPAGSSRTS
jgi:hypothetical protein